MMLPAFQIGTGDLIDLEGDQFADPDCNHPALASEYAQVIEVEEEDGGRCIAISFEGFDIVGFPRNHLLNIVGYSDEEE
jgi:hypothetical protein